LPSFTLPQNSWNRSFNILPVTTSIFFLKGKLHRDNQKNNLEKPNTMYTYCYTLRILLILYYFPDTL